MPASTAKVVGNDLVLNSGQVQGMADPSSAQHGATKNYVDTRLHRFASWGSQAAPATTSDRFAQAGVGGAPSSNEDDSVHLADFACTIVALRVYMSATLADTLTFTVRVNGADSGIVVAITSGNTTGSASGSVAVAAGDRVTLKMVQGGTTAASTLRTRSTMSYQSAA